MPRRGRGSTACVGTLPTPCAAPSARPAADRARACWLWTSAVLPAPPPVPPARAVFSHAADPPRPGLPQARLRDHCWRRWPAQLLGGLAAGAVRRARWRRACRRSSAAAAGAFVISAAALPFDFWAHRRAVDVGLDLQSDAGWARDALLAVRRPGAWPWPSCTALGGSPTGGSGRWASRSRPGSRSRSSPLLQPVLIDPLFSSTRPLPPAAAVARPRRWSSTMGAHPAVDPVADASSRTTGENAEVDGLGPTVRVVVDDTALRAPPASCGRCWHTSSATSSAMHTLQGRALVRGDRDARRSCWCWRRRPGSAGDGCSTSSVPVIAGLRADGGDRCCCRSRT